VKKESNVEKEGDVRKKVRNEPERGGKPIFSTGEKKIIPGDLIGNSKHQCKWRGVGSF